MEILASPPLVNWRYKDLNLYLHDQRLPAVGCGYYYIVTQPSATSHTAFRTKQALKIWLESTGLTMGRRSWGRSITLEGSYISSYAMMNTVEFFKEFGHLEPLPVLNNGNYSLGFVDKSGPVNIIYCQNPNTDRVILPYDYCSNLLETGEKWKWERFKEFANTLIKATVK